MGSQMKRRQKSAAYTEISRLATQLRSEKVRSRRQAGEELLRKLSDSKFACRLTEEAIASGSRHNGRKALCAIWRILITNALHAADEVLSENKRAKPTKEDIELPFRLLKLCDGSINEHNDVTVLINGRGSKMSSREIQSLLSYCLDMLTHEKAIEIAEFEILGMFAYLLSSPHYVAHFRPKTDINDCLVEIEKRILSPSTLPDRLSLTTSAFSGLISACSYTLGIGLHKYIDPCIQLVSNWCSMQSQVQNASKFSSDSIQKMLSVATNLISAHPVEAVPSVAKYGKNILVFARRYFASSHGVSKDASIEYFSAHL